MKNYKNLIAAIVAIAMILCLSACDGNDSQEDAAPDKDAETTGTTKGVAEKIAAVTEGDIYEIVPAEPYSDEDLDWHDSESRTSHEQNDESVRPKISSEDISLDSYSTIYIGYPIWWGQEPRIMDTFVENYDFGDKTVIPFCTSGSSSIDKSSDNLSEKAGSGKWLKGDRLDGSSSESDIRTWIEGHN